LHCETIDETSAVTRENGATTKDFFTGSQLA